MPRDVIFKCSRMTWGGGGRGMTSSLFSKEFVFLKKSHALIALGIFRQVLISCQVVPWYIVVI